MAKVSLGAFRKNVQQCVNKDAVNVYRICEGEKKKVVSICLTLIGNGKSGCYGEQKGRKTKDEQNEDRFRIIEVIYGGT